MGSNRRKPRDKGDQNLANRYRDGEFDAERIEESDDQSSEHFSARSKNAQQNKTARTALLRIAEQEEIPDLDKLPTGQVLQVYSLFCDVEFEGQKFLCVVRKTLTKTSQTQLVVGDYVRFRDTGIKDEAGRPEAVVEQVLPRKTILTRADSFKGNAQHPIVANSDQMLIVASARLPSVKWGLIDRMIIAARSGGLVPIVCLNKTDLLGQADGRSERRLERATEDETIDPLLALSHYTTLGIQTLQASVTQKKGLDELRAFLKDRATVLAGHSGVGKSSLIRAIQPELDIRIGEISRFTAKGKHTTTSARRYTLDFGGVVIDTPGVKLFGLWGVSRENLLEFFPDVASETAPPWRVQSYERIADSLSS
jgi:ribosome biogenesis GTPase / thiamine phosphate phosphatase